MNGSHPVDISILVQVAETLESIVSRCFGPHGGLVLFTKATGELLITRDGQKILSSLLLEQPIARVIVDSAVAHCHVTGDGAKSFILLLAALLRELHVLVMRETTRSTGPHGLHGLQLKVLSDHLLAFQTQVLDHIVRCHLRQCASSLFLSDRDWKVTHSNAKLLLEPYFYGKVGENHCPSLSTLACDYYLKCTGGDHSSGAVGFICDHFEELHTKVVGIPSSSSRILEGLVLHRDFTEYWPTEEELKILVVTEPLQPPLVDASAMLYLQSDQQLQSSCAWIHQRVQEILSRFSVSGVRLILSSVKQTDLVLYHAKLNRISVVECMDPEELSLFCSISGASPVSPWDILHGQPTHLAQAQFCKSILLGAHRYAHVGITSKSLCPQYCIVLCGPVSGLTIQCASALHGAFKMLRQTLQPLESRYGPHETSKNSELQNGIDTAAAGANVCPAEGEVYDGTDRVEQPRQCLAGNLHHSEPLHFHSCHVKEECCGDKLSEPHCTCNKGDATSIMKRTIELNAKSTGDNSLVINAQIDRIPCPTHEEECPCTLIPPGSVFPVGGSFELLLHYHLLKYASHCLEPGTKAVCKLVANALLSIPRNIYTAGKSTRHFLHVYTKAMRDIQSEGCVRDGPEMLESVSCKYQLLISTLECIRSLICIDCFIVGTRRVSPPASP
ncbi:Bardet-Biedl syndrome 10 protein [Polypterus senegalus]|uniref:Bardet-Biedl syndrome 10 protein n=1 Tax=Polypterus senegalus TaxID=55291 RepID=UPI0019654930|nr:Bardet-Biedl syndrome 10 protein [Polypterus senegalus]XP_039617828.1 Bardet-Biedl syndrome 10 protein [Polypterus senegalus]